MAEFGAHIESLQWDEIVFAEGKRSRRVRLPEVMMDARLESLHQLVRAADSIDEFLGGLPRNQGRRIELQLRIERRGLGIFAGSLGAGLEPQTVAKLGE